jgi:O-acetyl-ADP-ribose deacetylase (regulator of RNase III)
MSAREAMLEADELQFLCRLFASLSPAAIEAAFAAVYAPFKSEKAWAALLSTLEDLKSKAVHPPAAPSHTTTPSAAVSAGKRKAEEASDVPVPSAVAAVAAATTATAAAAAVTEERVESVGAAAKKAAVAGVTIVVGDLFDAKTNLGHCISADAKLGKGIATHFRSKFGGDAFINRIKEQNKSVGQVAAVLAGDRYIYNLVTKAIYHHKPTYDTLRAALRDMVAHMKSNGVKLVALPYGFGCGLDGLDWKTVLAILEEEIDGSGLTVQVFKQPPQ